MDSTNATHRLNAGVVIVGGGHAGGTIAAYLRQKHYTGLITLICEEDVAPYHRPPLSKSWLAGAQNVESLLLRPTEFYDSQKITLQAGVRALSIDRARQKVTLADGSAVHYSNLVLAMGAYARKLPVPGHDLQGVLSLRCLQDARALQAALQPGRRVVIVGGGYIGLETAATARKLGVEVTVVERERRLMARVSSPEVSALFEARHRAAGVELILQAPAIKSFQGCDGVVNAILLADGRTLPCDAVLVGVGTEPNDGLAVDAGLICDKGIVVNNAAQTSDPLIYAIGDVSHRPLPRYARTIRMESVANALEQARQAACAIVGQPAPPSEIPWFWSDQYDYKLQIAGLPIDADQVVHRADTAGNLLAVFHLQQGRLVAVEAINAAQEFMVGKKLIAGADLINVEHLRDSSIPMKDVRMAKTLEASA